ncbi:MAG: hypothetical protein H7345_16700, partial [Rubritepida sp.]|nr:hypothetical protein [Rubritepida sp.]
MRKRVIWLSFGAALLGLLLLDRALPPDLSRARALGGVVADRHGRILSVLPASGGVGRRRTPRARAVAIRSRRKRAVRRDAMIWTPGQQKR